MLRRIFLTIPPLSLLFAAQEQEEKPPLICPICRSEAELIDAGIYFCKKVGCGVLFMNNRSTE